MEKSFAEVPQTAVLSSALIMEKTRSTENAQLNWTPMAALWGFLSLILLIPGTSALQCYNYTTVQHVSRNEINTELSMAPNNVSTCSSGQTSCVELLLLLSTENKGMLVTHRGCVSDGLQDGEELTPSGDQHFSSQSKMRYCRSDLCNRELTDLSISKRPEPDKALQASNSAQCYSGFVLDPDQDVLDKAKCGRDSSQCYHGNATITAGNHSVDFLVKTCQRPSCNVPETQVFGPVELRLWGSCCQGAFCNGKATAPQSQNASAAAPRTSSPHEKDAVSQTTHFAQRRVNDTENASSVRGEVTVKPGRDWGPSRRSTTTQNSLYDYEDDVTLLFPPVDVTLNPRAQNVGCPKSSLPFYPLLVATGFAVLGIW